MQVRTLRITATKLSTLISSVEAWLVWSCAGPAATGTLQAGWGLGQRDLVGSISMHGGGAGTK